VAEFHAALVAAVRWVIAEGGSPSEVLDVIEKPWRWQVEADAARSLEDALNGLDD
jgi:hypothetical protein